MSEQLESLNNLEEKFSEWSDMGYSLSTYLYELLKIERERNQYLERRLNGTRDNRMVGISKK